MLNVIRRLLDENKPELIKAISDFLNGLDLQSIASIIVEIVDEVFDIAVQSGLIGEIGAFIATVGANIKTKILQLKIATFVLSLITKLKTAARALVESMPDVLKKPLNAIIGLVERASNAIIDCVNRMITKLGEFFSGVKIPEWTKYLPGVPAEIAGKDLGGLIGATQLSHITLPRLAKGAVIPPNKEFLAMLGDQSHGTNIEAPLDTIVDAFNSALNQRDDTTKIAALMQAQIELLRLIADRTGITDKAIANSVRRTNIEYVKQTGHGFLETT